MFYPFDLIRASRIVQSTSGGLKPSLPHVTPRVPRSVHAKFHADCSKTVGGRGIHTNRHTHTNRQTVILIYRLALRVTLCLFRLALQGYSVASLPRASRSHSQSLCSFGLRASHSYSRSLRSLWLHALHSHSQSLRSFGFRAHILSHSHALRAHKNF